MVQCLTLASREHFDFRQGGAAPVGRSAAQHGESRDAAQTAEPRPEEAESERAAEQTRTGEGESSREKCSNGEPGVESREPGCQMGALDVQGG